MTEPLNADRAISELEEHIGRLQAMARERGMDVASEIETLGAKLERLRMDAFKNLTAMERVQLARHPKRLYTLDYVERVFDDFMELHGDRAFRDDAAIVGGWARLNGEPVMVIGQQKGRDMKDNLRRNFGMPHPEGYRKALRLMQMADKFRRPVVTLIDTPGAWPGIGAEERGQAEAIARNLREMSRFRVPLISVVIGEGGSGGALALGVTDRILMLENATYSVITPEGCAAILWKTEEARDKAAASLRLTARDLKELGIVDEVIPEPSGGAHNDWEATATAVHDALSRHLEELMQRSPDQLRRDRWAKFDAMGAWRDDMAAPASS